MNQWLIMGIASLMPMVVGFIWYHKALFGNAWMKSIGKTEEDIQNGNMAVTFAGAFITAFLVAMFLYRAVNHDHDNFNTAGHGAVHGALVGVFLGAPILISNSLFEQKSWTNIMINAAYWITALTTMGAVIGALS